MNKSLYLSWHGPIAAALVAGAVAWSFAASGDRFFTLTSGWVALGLFLIAFAYVARKYAHKSGFSPEFRMKVSMQQLERAESRLNEIRGRILGGALTSKSEIEQRCAEALKAEKVHKVVRAEVVPTNSPEEEGPFHVLARPTNPLGRVSRWMHAHLYYGLAALFLVAVHGGAQFNSNLSIALNGLTVLVVGSGVIGIFFWTFGPARLTKAERDLPVEKAHALDQNLERKIRAAYDNLDSGLHPVLHDLERKAASSGSGNGFATASNSALATLRPQATDARLVEDVVALIGQRHGVKHELKRLQRVKMTMHAWRVLHIPAAFVLMVVVAIHVISVLWY